MQCPVSSKLAERLDEAGIVEVDGRTLSNWLPWHFDHCYNNELNRAGVLRALHIAPERGLTGFVDGIQAYDAMSPALLEKIEGLNIVHTLDLAYARARFGMPKAFREIRTPPGLEATVAIAKTLPRAIHPAVWTRASGEKVLHISPWGAVGIEGREDAEGDALLRGRLRGAARPNAALLPPRGRRPTCSFGIIGG